MGARRETAWNRDGIRIIGKTRRAMAAAAMLLARFLRFP
jgi:hypothetical protein